MISAADLRMGLRFAADLPQLLRHPLTSEVADRRLREHLDRRERDFLWLARQTIFARPASPYRPLLAHAGCEYGDLEQTVTREGVEAALLTLARAGVYVTVEEFKGHRPLGRGTSATAVPAAAFANPLAPPHLTARSGGSRGSGTPVPVRLDWMRDRALHLRVVFPALGWDACRVAVWGVPGAAAMVRILEYAAAGLRPERWFSPVMPDARGLHPRYRWSARVMRWASLAAGRPLPAVRHAPPADPAPVIEWIRAVRAQGGSPYLHTIASSAVRLAEAAAARGVTLDGVRLTLGSEPITPARLGAVRRAGAEAVPRYATAECGPIGFGCARPEAPDDVHLLRDLHAVVQPGIDLPDGMHRDTLLISSLRPSSALVLLNVSLGDRAVVRERRCGCPLERPGWTTHLRWVRSAEKLTAGGMALLHTGVVRVLEEDLPARFGGGPADFQLLEDEDDAGRPRLRLLVDPRVGPLDGAVVLRAFLDAVGGDGGAGRVAALTWQSSGILAVERRPPRLTAAGKILHLHARP